MNCIQAGFLRAESNECGQKAIVGTKNTTECHAELAGRRGLDGPNHEGTSVSSPYLHVNLLGSGPTDP